MTIARAHRRSLQAVASLGPVGMMSGSALLFAIAAALLIVVWGFAPEAGKTQHSQKRTWFVHGTTLVGLIAAVLLFPVARVDAVFLVLMLGLYNRYLLRGAHRDDLLIVGVSTVLMAAGTTVTPGLGFAVLVISFIPSVVLALWSSMLLGQVEEPESKATLNALAREPLPEGARRAIGLALVLTVLSFVSVLFLPRYRFAQFFMSGAFLSLGGAGDSMTIGTDGVSEAGLEGEVLFRLSPKDPDVSPGKFKDLYARLYSFDQFDGKRWTASSEGMFAGPNTASAKSAQNLLMEAWLSRTSGGGRQAAAAVGWEAPSVILGHPVRETSSGSWEANASPGRGLEYVVELGSFAQTPVLAPGIRERAEAQQVKLPDNLDPRIRELGQKLAENAQMTDEKVRAVIRYFNDFKYSLAPLEGTSEDPLARFLFEAKQGHCELYASATTVLLRAAGVRARVATGYYQGKWNDIGGFLAFSAKDAHAWTEVWFEDRGWRWIDATPPDMRNVRAVAWFDRLNELYEGLSAAWYDYVVEFDASKQRAFFEKIAEKLYAFSPSAPSAAGLEKESSTWAHSSSGSKFALFALGLLVLAAAYVFWKRRHDVGAVGARLRKALGTKSGENVTLGHLVRRSPASLRPFAEEAAKRYEALRFGPGGELSEVLDAIRRLERKGRERD